VTQGDVPFFIFEWLFEVFLKKQKKRKLWNKGRLSPLFIDYLQGEVPSSGADEIKHRTSPLGVP
jgi:hypothetical protein